MSMDKAIQEQTSSFTMTTEKGNETMNQEKPIARLYTASELDQLPGEEVVEKRTSNAKMYSLGQNRYQAVLFEEPMYDPEGKAAKKPMSLKEFLSEENMKKIARKFIGCMFR